MKTLGVYGAGGLGREIIELAKIINCRNVIWEELCFIVDDKKSQSINGYIVYEYEEAKTRYGSSLEVVMGIGEPEVRERLYSKIKADNLIAAALIHPDVHIPETTKTGSGSVIQYGCFISCNVTIGDNALLQPLCAIGHDTELKEGCIISSFNSIAGGCIIGEYAYLGMGATIKERTIIGDHSIIGMGSSVFKDIPDDMIAIGNPARPMKRNEDKQVFKR